MTSGKFDYNPKVSPRRVLQVLFRLFTIKKAGRNIIESAINNINLGIFSSMAIRFLWIITNVFIS